MLSIKKIFDRNYRYRSRIKLKHDFNDNKVCHKMDNVTLIKKKICLLGSFAVGKTSLTERFVHNRFDEKYLITIGVKISEKALPPLKPANNSKIIQHKFLIWDIAGCDKFDSVTKNYYRGAAGALAVADLTRPETIVELRNFCDRFLTVNPDAKLVIVGNKLDIFQNSDRSLSDLKKAAVRYSAVFELTSAKTGKGVEDAFLTLSQNIGAGL